MTYIDPFVRPVIYLHDLIHIGLAWLLFTLCIPREWNETVLRTDLGFLVYLKHSLCVISGPVISYTSRSCLEFSMNQIFRRFRTLYTNVVDPYKDKSRRGVNDGTQAHGLF